MSYYVLARKWRPQIFDDLIGQQHVVKALSYALSHNQIHHAYLFTGTRGVGKTSIARIFAKSLNCLENGISASPCGKCEHCVEISEGKFVDLIEVDAASRTGVDDTRELIDSIPYLPTKGRCKVYLIDEVHMFSNSSFNALLKTLEEPPEHVKFILATTDPEKLPITILSRCLQFNLKSLTKSQLISHLQMICQKEGIDFEQQALEMLAVAGSGSVRDTLSITDQALAYGQGQLRLDAVSEILGTTRPADVESVLLAIASNNPVALNQQLTHLDDYDIDAKLFLTSVMKLLQTMAWMKEGVVKSLVPSLQGALPEVPKELLHLWYDIAAKSLAELTNVEDEKAFIDMTLLRMCAFTPSDWVPRQYSPVDVMQVNVAESNTQVMQENQQKNNDTCDSQTHQKANFKQSVGEVLSLTSEVSDTSMLESLDEELAVKSTDNQPTNTELNTSQQESQSPDINDFAHKLQATPINNNNSLLEAEKHFISCLDGKRSEQPLSESLVEQAPVEERDNKNSQKSSSLTRIDNIASDDKAHQTQADEAPSFFSVDLNKIADCSKTSVSINQDENQLIDENTPPWDDTLNVKSSLGNEPVDLLSSSSADVSKSYLEVDEMIGHANHQQELEQPNHNIESDEAEIESNQINDPKQNLNDVQLVTTQQLINQNEEVQPNLVTSDEVLNSNHQPVNVGNIESVQSFDWFKMIHVLPFTPLIKHCLSMGVVTLQQQQQEVLAMFCISPHNSVLVTDQVLDDLSKVLADYLEQKVKIEVKEQILDQKTPMEVTQQKEKHDKQALAAMFSEQSAVASLVDTLGAKVLTDTIEKN